MICVVLFLPVGEGELPVWPATGGAEAGVCQGQFPVH